MIRMPVFILPANFHRQCPISTCGSAFDTTLAIFDGCPSVGNEIACNDYFCDLQAQITTNLNGGQGYFIRVAGFAGATGTFQIGVTGGGGDCLPTRTPTISETPTITNTPTITSTPTNTSFGLPPATPTLTLETPGGERIIYAGNFESGLGGWIIDNSSDTGLWSQTDECEALLADHSVPWALSFAQSAGCLYDLGTTSFGVVTTPPIDLNSVVPGEVIEFRFKYFMDVDTAPLAAITDILIYDVAATSPGYHRFEPDSQRHSCSHSKPI